MSVKSTNNASAAPHDEDAVKRPIRPMTDAEKDAAIASDPDWADMEPIDWSKAELVIPPKKQAISIRLDEDLIDFFKSEGPGYQRRINAVLRSYMQQRKAG